MVKKRDRLELLTSVLQVGHAFFYAGGSGGLGALANSTSTSTSTSASTSPGPGPGLDRSPQMSGVAVASAFGDAAAVAQQQDMVGTKAGLKGLPLQAAVFMLTDCLARAKSLDLQTAATASAGNSKIAQVYREEALQRYANAVAYLPICAPTLITQDDILRSTDSETVFSREPAASLGPRGCSPRCATWSCWFWRGGGRATRASVRCRGFRPR